MFADVAKIHIRSGRGGDGHVSFRRELYVPNGGPDGGDGGKGGDLIFEVDPGLNTLYDFRHKRKYVAEDGYPGGKKRCHGKNGKDLVIKVPAGTIIKEAESGKIMADLSYENNRVVLLKGGRGGQGNMHFATSTMQAPKYAQPGQDALELDVILELKSIADVGLIGFPNVGKSTFLSSVTAARPKIANYHFTTIDPNLGVVDLPQMDGFILADIPGLIEGASEGVGLGHKFLKHIERTRVLIHMLDASSSEGRDPIHDYEVITGELKDYNEEIAQRPQVIAANKIDCLSQDEQEEVKKRLGSYFEKKGIPIFFISAIAKTGVQELLYHVKSVLDQLPKEKIVFETEYEAFREEAKNTPYEVTLEEEERIFHVSGMRVEKMLGYTNIESEKGFEFFQKFMVEQGVIDRMKALGLQEGDTVEIMGQLFDYYE